MLRMSYLPFSYEVSGRAAPGVARAVEHGVGIGCHSVVRHVEALRAAVKARRKDGAPIVPNDVCLLYTSRCVEETGPKADQ